MWVGFGLGADKRQERLGLGMGLAGGGRGEGGKAAFAKRRDGEGTSLWVGRWGKNGVLFPVGNLGIIYRFICSPSVLSPCSKYIK